MRMCAERLRDDARMCAFLQERRSAHRLGQRAPSPMREWGARKGEGDTCQRAALFELMLPAAAAGVDVAVIAAAAGGRVGEAKRRHEGLCPAAMCLPHGCGGRQAPATAAW